MDRRQHRAKKSISLMEHSKRGDIHITVPLARRSSIARDRRAMAFVAREAEVSVARMLTD